MALTNDQITAQNFKDFYEQIYPYLGGGSGGGHTIQDDGTDMTARDNLNFVGMEVDDNDSDGSTDVSEHRLTSAEISEMMGGIPNPQPRYPVIFDERGTEYKVGWYILSNGTKKPVYRKDVSTGQLPNTATKSVAHNITNLEKTIRIVGFGYNPTSYGNMPIPNNDDTDVYVTPTNVVIVTTNNRTGVTESYVTLYYTKTTDTPV